MSTRMSLVVPCLISVSIGDSTAFGNSNLTVFYSSMAAAYSYASLYIECQTSNPKSLPSSLRGMPKYSRVRCLSDIKSRRSQSVS